MTVRVTRLDNGISVATENMPHLESVALGIWVGTGARFETLREHGISHLLEHMAFKGTKTRSAREIAEAIEAVGGEINAETSVDHTAYYVRLLKDDLLLGLDVLSDIVRNATFDPGELVREQRVIIQEIGAALDTPEDLVFDYFQQAAFPDQPIGRSILGTPDSVRALRAKDLRKFLGEHYRGPQIIISAAGNLDHDAMVNFIVKALGDVSGEPAPAAEPGVYKGGQWVEEKELQEAQILLGFRGPSFREKDLHPAHLLSSILGGGMASRLFQEVRENRGLCYSISSFHWPFADTGLFGISAATSEDVLGEMVPVIVDELRKLTDGVTAEELERAKAQTRAGLLMTLESPIARAGQIARHLLIHGRPLPLEEIVSKIEAVTARDIAEMAAGMLGTTPTLAAIGPVAPLPDMESIAHQLREFRTSEMAQAESH